jgi:hypothetical protein
MIARLAERRRFNASRSLARVAKALFIALGEPTFSWTFSSAFKVGFFSSC